MFSRQMSIPPPATKGIWKKYMYLFWNLSFPVDFLSMLSSVMDEDEFQPSYRWDYHKPQMMGSSEWGRAAPWTTGRHF